MKRPLLPFCVVLFTTLHVLRAAPPPAPDELYGALFAEVQRAPVFADQKTFPDCEPRRAPAEILARYAAVRARPGFDLRSFVASEFIPPPAAATAAVPGRTLRAHLTALWTVLQRPPDVARPGSSLLPLPHPYVVPGGRFREVYYWDTYFTMLGLRESGREDLMAAMVENFAHELTTYGLIPNGNRTYYLSRSQPPFFALMVELLAQRAGDDVYRRYRPALEAEYAYWMDQSQPTRHVVPLPGGAVLNRYCDQRAAPRDEAFATDEAAARATAQPAPEFYRNVRSAAESGWDFSSRWFADGRTLGTIETTDLVPIDLNCLLYRLELTLARAREATHDGAGARQARAAAAARRAAVLQFCWSSADGFFFDYDVKQGKRRTAWTLAGVVPLFTQVALPSQARRVASQLRERFLRPGGLVTTLVRTGQQWDAPNGWAPLEWMAVAGLASYGEEALAAEIAHRWIRLNRDVYARTGKLMEKYNVEDTTLPGGGGEYPGQDGFGWTNGVLLRLMSLYPDAAPPAVAAAAPELGRQLITRDQLSPWLLGSVR